MSGTEVGDGEEFDCALAAFFPEPPHLIFESDMCNGHSQDSDSETEVVVQYPDPFNAGINVQELTSDFVENVLPQESNDVEAENACSCGDNDQDPDTQTISEKLRTGCKCKQGNCLSSFDKDDIYQLWLTLSELDGNEYDLMILGKLQECSSTSSSRLKNKDQRERQRFKYTFLGKAVCEDAFQFIHKLGKKKLENLRKHFKTHGVSARIHGLKGRQPPNAHSFAVIENVVKFLKQYGVVNGMPMPAAPRGRNDVPPVFLPAYETKDHVYKMYVESCGDNRHVKLTLFKMIWKHCLPHIQIIKPRSDLCHKCVKLREAVSAARSDNDKLVATRSYMDHIETFTAERNFYNECIQTAKESIGASNIQPGIHEANANDITTHYVFDYSQMFSVPHFSQQVGPLYFITPRKVQCFGICNSSIPLQTNYLLDEDSTIGKDGTRCHGPNSIISLLHRYLEEKSYGEKYAVFHADNAAGQNKNKTMIHYLLWRCFKGLNTEIKLHFMTPGHTKCICDACFGLIRLRYMRSDTQCLQQLASVVESSAVSNEAIIPPYTWYEWDAYFNRIFRCFKGISKFHHFRFTSTPGVVFAKVSPTAAEERIVLLKPNIDLNDACARMPNVLNAAGLSADRALYLFRHVRPFCSDEYKDITCPPVN